MTTLPDFTTKGYQVTELLHENNQGGRIAYKAVEIATQKPVVIKQFRFATNSNWDSYKQIEREIEVLQGLDHEGIPKYLNKFDSDDGLCLVQEYKNAQPLSKIRSFSQDEIKNIAVQLLDILAFLQARIPPIFHRDIKPENVLVDDKIKVYLIDFGIARIGNNTMAVSTMMGGTLGFMPPEQVHNQKLTEASDLYGLGATLICLITQTKSIDIGSLVNFSTNKINFKNKVPQFSLRFIQWLEKMVEPNPVNRYQNAKLALEALNPLYIKRIPEAKLDKLELNFVANSVNKKLSQTITLTNKIPDTILQGKWSVSPHRSDPPHNPDRHSWISFSPQEIKGNNVKCEVKVDTSKLKIDQNYEREIVFISNAQQEKYYLKVKVKTALIKQNISTPPYGLIIVTGLVLAVISVIILTKNVLLMVLLREVFLVFFLALIEGIFLIAILPIFVAFIGVIMGVIFITFIGIVIGVIFGPVGMSIGGILGLLIGIAGSMEILKPMFKRLVKDTQNSTKNLQKKIIGFTNNILNDNFYKRGFNNNAVALYLLLTTATGILTGVSAVIGFNPYLLTGLGVSALPLSVMLIYPPLKLQRLKAQYRRQESQNLIKP